MSEFNEAMAEVIEKKKQQMERYKRKAIENKDKPEEALDWLNEAKLIQKQIIKAEKALAMLYE